MVTTRAALAHQGGWDELAYFAVPAVLAILAIRWAEKRAGRRRTNKQDDGLGDDEKTSA